MKRVVLFLLIFILIISCFCGCNTKKTQLSIFFKDIETNNLTEEKHEVETGGKKGAQVLAKLAVAELCKGPLNEKSVPVINKDAKLISLALNNGVATVNMSKHFAEKTGVDGLILRYSFIKTLCSIDGIDKVVIQVEGVNLVGEDGKEIPPLGNEDYVDPENAQRETVKLYFPNSDGTALGSEIRNIEIQNMPSLEKAVVTELINGPKDKSLSKALPEGTKLLGIEIKDKICYVNFSKEFVNNAGSGSSETTMILYSVVNSLCDLDSVDSVQILIEGKTDEEFGNFVFDIPYEANYDYNE